MLRFVIRRLLLMVLTLFVVSSLTFLLFYVAPADPARIACGTRCTGEQIEQVRHNLGLDESVWVQYGEFMSGLVVGRTIGEGDFARECAAPCFGESFLQNEMVTPILVRALPITISIALGAWILQTVLAIGLGVLAARKRGTWVDKSSVTASLIGAALPVYFIGPLLLLIFRYNLEWLPQPGYTSFFSNPLTWAAGMIFPWMTLAIIGFAFDTRLTRSQMLETLDEDFIRTSRAKGLSDRKVYWRHALRASMTPIATSIGLGLGGLLGGGIVTETIFGLRGIGFLSVEAVRQLNMPIVMGTVMIAAFFIVVSTFVVDMLYAVIDPRVRLS